MHTSILRLLGTALLGAACFAQSTAADAAAVADARFLDARWQPRRLHDIGDRPATVLYFVTVDCPMVRRYLPRMGAVAEDYRQQGVLTMIVNVGLGDVFSDAVAQAVEHAPEAVFAKDQHLEIARACGVDRSGAVVVLDRERRVRYRGRIDDQHGFAGSRDRPHRHDLRAALDQVLGGNAVEVERTEVVGCRITPRSIEGAVPSYQEVAPILQRHCMTCHGSDATASFSLIGQENVRKHAAMIDEVVTYGRMPPWAPVSSDGPFVNRRGLSLVERETVHAWVAGGMPRSEASSTEAMHVMPPEWSIGRPALVIEAADLVEVEGDGPFRYHDVVFAHAFDKDVWVEAIELRSRGGAPLHHANLAMVRDGTAYVPDGHIGNQVLHGGPIEFEAGSALRIPAGTKLVARLLYVPNGRSSKERVQLAMRFPRPGVRRDVRIANFGNGTFRIPPHAASHRVEAEWTLPEDGQGVSIFVHMHLRGRDVTVVAETPDGARKAVLTVPSYSFAGQETYVWWRGSCSWPKGTRFHATAHFDNSSWNTANPDPAATVEVGPGLEDERFLVSLCWLPSAESVEMRVDPASGTVVSEESSPARR